MRHLFQTLLVISLTWLSAVAQSSTNPGAVWVVPEGEYYEQANQFGCGTLLPFESTGWEIMVPDMQVEQGGFVEIDFSFKADATNAPYHYALEYRLGDKWIAEDTIKAVMEHPANGEFSTYLHTLQAPAAIDTLRLRLRGLEEAKERVRFAHQSNVGISILYLGNSQPKDTLRVLCIGNSFTYVYQVPYMLKRLAWSEGHYLDIEAALRGGYNFGNHLKMQGTDEAIKHGGYDFVFLQNQSQTNAWFAQDSVAHKQVLKDARELVRRVRQYSPKAQIIIESTWAYPGGNYGGFGSYETYDSLMERGSEWLAADLNARVSYINRGFIASRKHHPKVAIYGGDDKHQSALGSYLKACVNYRVIYGKALPVKTKNPLLTDFWFSPAEAESLRSSARK